MSVKANFDAAVSQIDLEEMIDYYLLNIYCGTWDWPNNNWVAARQRAPEGRWRFYVWDAEGSFGHSGNKPPNYDTILLDLKASSGGLSQVFRLPYAVPEVKLRFADRINHWFFNGQMLDDRTPATARIAQLKTELTTPFAPLLNFTYGVNYDDSFWLNWTTATTANANDGIWTSPMSSRRSHLFNTNPVPTSNLSFRAHQLWPGTEPVTFSQHGGKVTAGFTLAMSTNTTVPAGSSIHYTLDGTDPRSWGGAVAPGALSYSTAVALPGPFARVYARVRNATTGEWSALTSADFLSDTEAATAANLVVSQLHYHPSNPTPAEVTAGFTTDESFEFIELMAIGTKAVDLSQVQVISGVFFDFASTGATRVLPPGQRVLLVKDLAAFQLRYGHAHDAAIAGTYLGSLRNSGETLWITGSAAAAGTATRSDIQKFSYSDTAPWPEPPDGQGPSLVLMNPSSNPDPNNGINWRASTQPHGTPLASDALGYNTWAGTNTIQDLLGTQDPDADGLANLLEYFLGSDPHTSSPASLPTVAGADGDYLTLTFTRPLGRDDVRFEVQTTPHTSRAPKLVPRRVRLQHLRPQRDGNLSLPHRGPHLGSPHLFHEDQSDSMSCKYWLIPK